MIDYFVRMSRAEAFTSMLTWISDPRSSLASSAPDSVVSVTVNPDGPR